MAEPLKIRFATDIDGAKRGIQDLTATVVSNMLRVGGALKAANDNVGRLTSVMSALPTAVRAAAGAFLLFEAGKLAIEGIEKLTRAAADQVERLAAIGRQADSLGVSSTFLQGLTKQAEALGYKTDDVVKSLERLKAVSIVKQGDGGAEARNESAIEASLRKQAAAGNVTPADVTRVTSAPDNEARFQVLIDLMRRLTEEGRKLAALDIGSRFLTPDIVDRIRNSSVELDKLQAAAKSAADADVFSRDQIDRATELNRRMTEAHRILSDGLKPIYDDLAQAGYNFHKSNVEWVEFLARRIPQIINLYGDLKAALNNAGRQTAGLPLQGAGRETGDFVGKAIADAARGDRAEKPAAPAPSAAPAPAPSVDPAMAAARDQLKARINPTTVARAQSKSEDIASRVFGDRTNPTRNVPKAGGSGGETESADAIERFVRAMEKANEVAKAELETVGKSNVEKEKSVALAKLNAAAKEAERAPTEAEIATVNRLAEATQRQKDALADQRQAAQQSAEAMRNFGQQGVDALTDMIFEGKSFDDVMKNLAKTLAKQALNGLLLGTGPFSGLLGTAAPASAGANAQGGLLGLLVSTFGGAHAGGGDIPANSWGIVGEKGPELIGPTSGRRTVLPNGSFGAPPVQIAIRAPAVPSMMGAGAAAAPVTVNNYLGDQAQVTTTRGQNGSLDIAVRAIEGRLMQRAQSGRGPMAQVIGAAAYRRG